MAHARGVTVEGELSRPAAETMRGDKETATHRGT
jgi:hypothetical protein